MMSFSLVLDWSGSIGLIGWTGKAGFGMSGV